MPFKHNLKCKPLNRSRKLQASAEINGFRPIFVYPENGKYVGEWVKNKRDGFGAKHEKNCLIYDGQWKDNKRNGMGSLRKRLSDGTTLRIYIGQWKDNMKHGEGKKFYNNGIYFGWWKEDMRSGLGIMWYNNGAIYLGEWEKDLYNGAGVHFHKNGNRYEGFFKHGLKHGEGIFYHMKTGQIQKGMWEFDLCKTSIMFDEFRNQAIKPTCYAIPETRLVHPDKLVHDLFRQYLPTIEEATDAFKGVTCVDFLKKIKMCFPISLAGAPVWYAEVHQVKATAVSAAIPSTGVARSYYHIKKSLPDKDSPNPQLWIEKELLL